VEVLDRMTATGRQVRRQRTLQSERRRLPAAGQGEHHNRKEDENKNCAA
jgi:hypothetical protein